MTVNNPIVSKEVGIIRDPMILFDDGKYYMTGTVPQFWTGENPGVKLWSSEDLHNWKFEKLIVDSSKIADDKPFKDRFWAPELFVHNGKYFCIFNAQNEKTSVQYSGLRSYIAVSDKINGDYRIIEKPLIDNGGMTNDAHLFRDDDGKVYVFYTIQNQIRFNEFYPETCTTSTESRLVIEIGKEGEWDSIGIEGSFVVKRGGIYYHWYSSWTRSYEMGLAVTEDLNKPFRKLDINPVITNYENASDFQCGHNSCFVLPDGRDAIAFHINNSQFPESLCINTVEYPITSPKTPDKTIEI